MIQWSHAGHRHYQFQQASCSSVWWYLPAQTTCLPQTIKHSFILHLWCVKTSPTLCVVGANGPLNAMAIYSYLFHRLMHCKLQVTEHSYIPQIYLWSHNTAIQSRSYDTWWIQSFMEVNMGSARLSVTEQNNSPKWLTHWLRLLACASKDQTDCNWEWQAIT